MRTTDIHRSGAPTGTSAPGLLAQHRLRVLAAREHLIHATVLERLLGAQDLVAVDVPIDLFDAPLRMFRKRLLEPRAHAHDLARLELDVARLAVAALTGRGLVDQHAGVRQSEPLAGGAAREQHGGGRGGLAEADRL